MFAYVIRRLFIMIPTLLAISFLIFVIIQAPARRLSVDGDRGMPVPRRVVAAGTR